MKSEAEIEKEYLLTGKINIDAIVGKQWQFKKLKFVWWGLSQWYKWRWFNDHIDLGMLSIYNLSQEGIGKLGWRFISILIKPMRIFYHKIYVRR